LLTNITAIIVIYGQKDAGRLDREVKLCYGFVRRDLGTGMLPVPGVALASLLYREAPSEEIIRAVGRALS
jgi:hypothetical protein